MFTRLLFMKGARSISLVAALLLVSTMVFAETLGPIAPSADGLYRQWKPKSGSTHYAMVDEAACNGVTDYNYTTTVGSRDSYVVSLGSIPNGSKITQISITPCASKHKSGGSNSTMNVFYRFSGVNSSDAGAYSLAGTTPVALAATNFMNLSHLTSATSTLEIGAVLSAGGKGARLGRMTVQVTYAVLHAPSNLTATPSGSQVVLNWADYSAAEDGFAVERSTDGVNFAQIGTVGTDVVGFTDTTSAFNVTYWYRVRAYNAAAHSPYSNITTATTLSAPNTPTNLTATPSGAQVSLVWIDSATNEDGFVIERKTWSGNFVQIAVTGVNVSSYTDTTSVADTSYVYRVRAYNAAGNSAYSNVAPADTVPDAPTSLSASVAGSQVSLSWIDNALVEYSFAIERSTDGVNFTQIDTAFANATTYTDSGSVINAQYWYRVRAYNAAGNSAYSNTAFISTALPLAPSNLAAVLSGASIVLTWVDNSLTETSFHVERKVTATGSYMEIATTGPNITIYTDYPFFNTYTYRVRASNAVGFSGYSNESTITFP